MIGFLSMIPTASRKTRCVVSAASPNRSVTTGEDGDDFRQRLGYPRSPAKVSCSFVFSIVPKEKFVSNISAILKKRLTHF